MIYLFIKAAISGILVALIAEIAKRNPAWGGLLASLPLISILGMIWLWRDTKDTQLMAAHIGATFWFVLPSLPMFLIMPILLRHDFGFWPSLLVGSIITMALYALMIWAMPKFGVRL